MIGNGDINVTPEFQRDVLWDIKKASLFIDSLLVGLPTPSLSSALGPTRLHA